MKKCTLIIIAFLCQLNFIFGQKIHNEIYHKNKVKSVEIINFTNLLEYKFYDTSGRLSKEIVNYEDSSSGYYYVTNYEYENNLLVKTNNSGFSKDSDTAYLDSLSFIDLYNTNNKISKSIIIDHLMNTVDTFEYYFYDELGRLIENNNFGILEFIDTSRRYSKTIYKYVHDNLIDTIFEYKNSIGLGSCMGGSKLVDSMVLYNANKFEYDKNGNMITKYSCYKSWKDSIVCNKIETNEYDGLGNLIFQKTFLYGRDAQDWDYILTTYTYKGKRLISSKNESVNDDKKIENEISKERFYKYNRKGLLTEEIKFFYDKNEEQKIEVRKYITKYSYKYY